jgi:D-alanyl-D-alanine carboxypeptidase (penicillin-binding protein 5/6)
MMTSTYNGSISTGNPLLFMELGGDGLKAGFVENSGTARRLRREKRQRLIVVVSGCRTAKERAKEARKLLQWGFRARPRRS